MAFVAYTAPPNCWQNVYTQAAKESSMSSIRSTQVTRMMCKQIIALCDEIDDEQTKCDKATSDAVKRKQTKAIEDYWNAIETIGCTITSDV